MERIKVIMLTAEDIKKANDGLPTVDVKGKGYVMVTERVKAFRKVCPNGSIDTNLLAMDNGVVTIVAKIYDENDHLLASGMAQEKESSSFINKTSYVENCETSAVGRALGMLGIGIDESMASAEEVANAIKNQDEKAMSTSNSKASTVSNKNEKTDALSKEIAQYAKEHGMTMAEIAKDYQLNNKTATAERLQEVLDDLKGNAPDDFAAIDEAVPF